MSEGDAPGLSLIIGKLPIILNSLDRDPLTNLKDCNGSSGDTTNSSLAIGIESPKTTTGLSQITVLEYSFLVRCGGEGSLTKTTESSAAALWAAAWVRGLVPMEVPYCLFLCILKHNNLLWSPKFTFWPHYLFISSQERVYLAKMSLNLWEAYAVTLLKSLINFKTIYMKSALAIITF